MSIHKLKEIHTATHPGAKLERSGQRAVIEDLGKGDAGDVVTHRVEPPATREALLSSLAAEAAEEETEQAGD